MVYELNTGKIVSASWISSSEPQSGQGASSDGSVSMVPLSGTPAWMAPYRIDPESGTLLAPNQNAVNASTDPNRDGLLASFMCIGEGDLPWKVDPWSARLVPA